jgi:hypothetical protein
MQKLHFAIVKIVETAEADIKRRKSRPSSAITVVKSEFSEPAENKER